MEGRKCSNTTLLIEAIALMNDAQERLQKVEINGADNDAAWAMTNVGMAEGDVARAIRSVRFAAKHMNTREQEKREQE
nr:MAG TPA: hypothetical protein [Caudoviricetes sp.]